MNDVRLQVGIRIFNHGDMANPSHFGTITEVAADQWSVRYRIMPDAPLYEGDREAPYWIPAALLSERYLGHGGTRIVTESEHRRYRAERIEALKLMIERHAKGGSHA